MKRWQVIAVAVVLILGVAVVAGYRMGVRLLQGKIVEALGPGSLVRAPGILPRASRCSQRTWWRSNPISSRKTRPRVSKGTLDLNLDSEVRNNNLDGKGKVILKNLEFAPARGFFDTFMGLPRNAVIGFLKDHDNTIAVEFTLKGNTSHPNFSLNESLSTRIATAIAGQLGVDIKDFAEGLGTLGRKGLEGAGGVVEGVGSAVNQLFGGGKKQ
jgi:hypothetical protein